jgi:sensor c-di-GMP phosphodiesterase-like protein
MPTENEKKVENLIDVGEADQQATEINLDDKGEPEKVEAPVEEKIEVEQVEDTTKDVDKSFENERETKLENKDELKEYSDGVQKRIAKLTRKMREAERQREEAVAYAQSIKSKNDEMEGRISKMDSSYVSEFESRVKTGLAAAKLALKNAIESQDVEAQIAAQQQLAALTMDEARVNSLKVANENKPKASERQVNINPQQQRAPQQQADPRAEDWASKNSWFGNDSAMTYTAFDIHKTLVEKEGFDPQSNEYYAEVDKRIRLEFPHKFDKVDDTSTERVKPTQNVASAKRSASTGRKKTVRLTPSQVAIAKRLGVPLEAYAKQLKITEGA